MKKILFIMSIMFVATGCSSTTSLKNFTESKIEVDQQKNHFLARQLTRSAK